MVYNYGRNNTKRQTSSVFKQVLWVFSAYLLGFLTASFFDYASLSHWINTQILATHNDTQKLKSTVARAPLPKPKFEFYTLLASNEHKAKNAPEEANKAATPAPSQPGEQTKLTVAPVAQIKVGEPPATLALNQEGTTVAAAAPAPAPTAVPVKESFLIQVGSFKARADALNLQATLVLKGFTATVASSPQGGTTWFRVLIGPYADKGEAQKAQADIARTEHVMGMIRKTSA